MSTRERQVESIEAYGLAWGDVDEAERMTQLRRAFVDGDSLYVDNEVPDGLRGIDELAQFIDETRAELPGIELSVTSEIDFLPRWAWFEWEGVVDGAVVMRGVDFVEFDEIGRIAKLIDFDHVVPS